MKKPLFSIITVTKNCSNKIMLTLKSVKSQTFKNFEHIVVDGFSKDNTYAIIKKFNHQKIKSYQIKDNGIYEGFNNALDFCKGEFIFILNAGDVFFDKNILKFVNQKIRKNDDIAIGNCLFFDKNLNVKRVWIKDNYINFYNCYNVPHTGLFINKRIIKNIGKFNNNYRISSDTDYILRIFKDKKIKINNIKNYFVFMELGGASTNIRTAFTKILEDLIIYYRYFNILFLYYYFRKIFSKVKQYKLTDQSDLSNILKKIL